MHELLAKARLETGLKITRKNWCSDEYIYWNNSLDSWVNENKEPYFLKSREYYFTWYLYEELSKTVKWYRPAIIWDKDEKDPYCYYCHYQTTKTLDNWFKYPDKIKVLKWDEIEASATWEQCK